MSVPLYRVVKVSLSDVVLNSLREISDVLIIAPFAEKPSFQQSFGGKNTFFLKWDRQFSKCKILILGVSEMMRRLGYYRKFRNKGMLYYMKNQYVKFGLDGKDTKLSWIQCAVYWLLSHIGKHRHAWLIVEKVISGKDWYQFPELVNFSKKYKNITLIQSINWGIQERALARLSMEQNWRKVLLPYMSDQLLTNGYLLNNFDAVCVQGDVEFNQALNYHLIPEKRIYKLGSCWFRFLKEFRLPKDQGSPVILYAGISNLYYHSQDEFDCVDAIIDFISLTNKKYKLIYRPVVFDESLEQKIRKKYEGVAQVQLQWPTNAELGLTIYKEINQKDALYKYVNDMVNCRLFIMSFTVSMSLDVAFLKKCGIIANMIDHSGTLKKRYKELYSMFITPLFTGVRIVSSVHELLYNIQDLLDNPDKGSRETAKLVSLWDYPNSDFKTILYKAVYNL